VTAEVGFPETQKERSVETSLDGLGRVPLSHPRRRSEISTRLYTVTMRRAFVRHTGHALYGSESNRLVLPSHYQIGIAPPEGCAHFSLR
jgi:hypothetical protein